MARGCFNDSDQLERAGQAIIIGAQALERTALATGRHRFVFGSLFSGDFDPRFTASKVQNQFTLDLETARVGRQKVYYSVLCNLHSAEEK